MLFQITAALLHITTMCYYKLRQLYQVITNYDRYYKLRRYFKLRCNKKESRCVGALFYQLKRESDKDFFKQILQNF